MENFNVDENKKIYNLEIIFWIQNKPNPINE